MQIFIKERIIRKEWFENDIIMVFTCACVSVGVPFAVASAPSWSMSSGTFFTAGCTMVTTVNGISDFWKYKINVFSTGLENDKLLYDKTIFIISEIRIHTCIFAFASGAFSVSVVFASDTTFGKLSSVVVLICLAAVFSLFKRISISRRAFDYLSCCTIKVASILCAYRNVQVEN